MQYILPFIGKHASRALPVGVLLGLLIPVLAEYLQPFLLPALLVPLTLSLVRIESKQLLTSVKQWRVITAISCWVLVLSPAVVWLILELVALPEPISRATLITAAAPPVTACAAIAIYLRLDAAIAVVITVVTMLLVPITLPPIILYLVGLQVDIALWQLSLRLAGFILAAFCLAALIKKLLGKTRVHQHAVTLDGISVIFISLFIIGLMHGVTALILQKPWYVLHVFAASALLVLGLYIVATLMFWRLGPRTAMAVGLVSGNCNMGLMYLVLADQASLDLLIFFAIGQIPMYFLPALLTPLINRFIAR
jgi:BASS family bile acid:Na+ symporter